VDRRFDPIGGFDAIARYVAPNLEEVVSSLRSELILIPDAVQPSSLVTLLHLGANLAAIHQFAALAVQ
jgi:hypothetical protein